MRRTSAARNITRDDQSTFATVAQLKPSKNKEEGKWKSSDIMPDQGIEIVYLPDPPPKAAAAAASSASSSSSPPAPKKQKRVHWEELDLQELDGRGLAYVQRNLVFRPPQYTSYHRPPEYWSECKTLVDCVIKERKTMADECMCDDWFKTNSTIVLLYSGDVLKWRLFFTNSSKDVWPPMLVPTIGGRTPYVNFCCACSKEHDDPQWVLEADEITMIGQWRHPVFASKAPRHENRGFVAVGESYVPMQTCKSASSRQARLICLLCNAQLGTKFTDPSFDYLKSEMCVKDGSGRVVAYRFDAGRMAAKWAHDEKVPLEFRAHPTMRKHFNMHAGPVHIGFLQQQERAAVARKQQREMKTDGVVVEWAAGWRSIETPRRNNEKRMADELLGPEFWDELNEAGGYEGVVRDSKDELVWMMRCVYDQTMLRLYGEYLSGSGDDGGGDKSHIRNRAKELAGIPVIHIH